jgi:hypothetical protein
VRHFKVTYEQFESLKIISDLWVHKSLIRDEVLDFADFNLGLIFKIMISGDRSMFHDKKAAAEKLKSGT